MGKIVMPKNSALLDEIEAVLEIYNETGDWTENGIYKQRLKSIIGDDQYSSSYTKKSQITSYFGFTEWEDINNSHSRRRITSSGKKMYEALKNGDNEKVSELIMNALETVKFGRDNAGCPETDSDVEPPDVFIRGILDLGYLTYKEFAFILWKLEDLGANYTDVIKELKTMRSAGEITLGDEARKYTDCKPIMMLVRWGFLMEDESDSTGGKHIVITPSVKTRFIDRLRRLKIYNIDKFSEDKTQEDTSGFDYLSKEWFIEKSKKYMDRYNNTIVPALEQFSRIFSPSKLQELDDSNLLQSLFLNAENDKGNLCYALEFDKDYTTFGSIKGGSAAKFGLYYGTKTKAWTTGKGKSTKVLDDSEAIDIGRSIRSDIISLEALLAQSPCHNEEEYKQTYESMSTIGNSQIDRMFVLKYLYMLHPDKLVCFYNSEMQKAILKALGITMTEDSRYVRMGQLSLFSRECGIPSWVFSEIIMNDTDIRFNDYSEKEIEDEENMKSCLEIERNPRTHKLFPLNFIIYGAPGTGKTYSTAEYAVAIIENRPADLSLKSDSARKDLLKKYKDFVKKGQIVFTTFHQNYGYEEFIQGLRPDDESESLSFITKDGILKTIADRALNDSDDNNYVIIIDEINRANISKVFGELITLIEEDKRWGELNETSATLQSGAPFAIPNNLYIIGTMNSADKSISLIDAALRRRFSFIEQAPNKDLVGDKVLRDILDYLNTNLVSELDSTDLLVGHSYFMNKSEKDLCEILNNSIIPLLYEYFYDDRKKVANIVNGAINSAKANIVIIDEPTSRLRVATKDESDDSQQV